MATVIDSLIVTLGLDPRDFTKGQKVAAKELLATEKKVQGASDNMGKAITGAARKFAVAFLGFTSAAGIARMVAGLNDMEKSLHFLGKNTNNSVTDLRDWSRMVELAGGSAEGLLKTVQQIATEQSRFQLTGQTDMAGPLRALGMDPNSLSEAKSELDFLMQLSEKLQGMSKLQGGRQRAFTLGQMMGIDEGTLNALLEGPAKIRAELARQRQGFRLTDKEAEAAQGTSARITRLKQRGQDFLTLLMAKLRPIVDKWADKIEQWLASVDLNKVASSIDQLVTAIANLAGLISTLVDMLGPIFKWVGEKIGNTTGAVVDMFGQEGRDRMRDMTRGFNANPELEKLHNIALSSSRRVYTGKENTIADIVDSLMLNNEDKQIKLMSMLSGATGKSATEQLKDSDYEKIEQAVKLRAIAEARKASQTGAAGAAASGTAAGAANAARDTQRGASISTISINKIEIRTDTTNAAGVADGIQRELARRGLVVQADTGLA